VKASIFYRIATILLRLIFMEVFICGCATNKNIIQFLPGTYQHDVAKWIVVPHPESYDSREGNIWYFSAAYSYCEWFVYNTTSNVCAILAWEKGCQVDQTQTAILDRTNQSLIMLAPPFKSKIEKFGRNYVALRVDDGWLIGFAGDEVGAALYWFSVDGNNNYKISDHRVIQFLTVSGDVYAIEGLAHMSYNKGSFIKVKKRDSRWSTSTVAVFGSAPYAAVALNHKELICVLSDSLSKINLKGEITPILDPAACVFLNPNSVAVSHDKKYVYIGMRQFVAEVTMDTGTLRYLIPSKTFLNKLTKEQLKHNIGNQYK
jgi:hypothetical protein